VSKLTPDLPDRLADRVAGALQARRAPLLVGLTGPQGSGKTTIAGGLASRLVDRGLRTAVLALDDLYLPRAERARLAAEVHPLFITRGVPGTHDVALGASILASLPRPGPTLIPRFDKGLDDRAPPRDARRLEGPFDVILFEGWCVGARPQPPEALAAPINDLERDRDREGVWRRAVNDALAGAYRSLFAPIAFQLLLRPPSFEVVLGWRRQQEADLRAQGGGGQSDAELAVFVQHYERLTRWIDEEAPARADAVVRLGRQREALELEP
jgi:D-glycerate 3-kinase